MSPSDRWRSFTRSVDFTTGAFAVLGVLVVAILLTAATTSSQAYDFSNGNWNGTSALEAEARAAGATPVLGLESQHYDSVEPNRTVAVVLVRTEPYSDSDVVRIRRFVERGGTLIVADEFGPARNELLRAVGADARIDGRLLRDERHNYRSPTLPVATNITAGSGLEQVDQLTLNHASAVRPNGATVLVSSSPYGYLDTDGDGELDDNETLRSWPVLTVEQVGEGRLYTLSDPSVLANSMLERPDNAALVRALFGDSRVVLLDFSHAGRTPLLTGVMVSVRQSPVLQAAALSLCLAGVVLVGSRIPTTARRWLRRHTAGDRPVDVGPTRSESMDYLERRHPRWDKQAVERVTATLTALVASSDEPDDDETNHDK